MMTFGFKAQASDIVLSAGQPLFMRQVASATLDVVSATFLRITGTSAKCSDLTALTNLVTDGRTYPVLVAFGTAPFAAADKAPGPSRRAPITYPVMPAHLSSAAAR